MTSRLATRANIVRFWETVGRLCRSDASGGRGVAASRGGRNGSSNSGGRGGGGGGGAGADAVAGGGGGVAVASV